jgi:hypothetical protein
LVQDGFVGLLETFTWGSGLRTTWIDRPKPCQVWRQLPSRGDVSPLTPDAVGSALLTLLGAATDTCSAGTLITDEWFSYDKDGHATDLWQSSPHSTQYYHSVATYAGNGAVTSLQLASPSLYTLTYGLDGEGRWNTLKQGSTNIVTGPLTGMYDSAGRVLNVQLTGSTPDHDIYIYDLNTGRMKTFEFEVGSSNLTGTLTWNANGTLSQSQIVDGFNLGGSQVCAFGYDDLSRLLTDACGGENYILLWIREWRHWLGT